MKANRIHRFGSPDVIEFEDAEIPMPGDGEVLVRVKAAGVGPWDALIRSGKSVLPQPLPLTLGTDLAGSIEALGNGTSDFTLGDEVFGATSASFTGAYAEFAVASMDTIARKPQRSTPVESASVPVVAVTAWQLLDRAALSPGQTVLIHGAAGSVGGFAIVLAKLRGLNVIATIASDDGRYVCELGADVAIDVRTERFEHRAGRVDAVIDTVGAQTQSRSFGVIDRGGSLISIVSPPDEAEAERHGVRASFLLVDVKRSYLTQIARLMDDGTLQPRVGTVLSLAEAREAHEMLEGRRPHPHGKIVLRVIANWKR